MKEKKDSSGLLIKILVLIIVVLLSVILYAFAIKPAIAVYVVKALTKGYEYAILQIVQQASACQVVPLTFGNQTIEIVSVECLQQQFQMQ